MELVSATRLSFEFVLVTELIHEKLDLLHCEVVYSCTQVLQSLLNLMRSQLNGLLFFLNLFSVTFRCDFGFDINIENHLNQTNQLLLLRPLVNGFFNPFLSGVGEMDRFRYHSFV